MKKEPVSINISHSQGVHITYSGGFLITLLAAFIFCATLYVSPFSPFSPQTVISNHISHDQAEEIRKLVTQVAEKEQLHPNKVHNELKQKMNYVSYRKMDEKTYFQVKKILLNRLK